MYKLLVVALFAACAINVVSLCGHLGGVAAPVTGSAVVSPIWVASLPAE